MRCGDTSKKQCEQSFTCPVNKTDDDKEAGIVFVSIGSVLGFLVLIAIILLIAVLGPFPPLIAGVLICAASITAFAAFGGIAILGLLAVAAVLCSPVLAIFLVVFLVVAALSLGATAGAGGTLSAFVGAAGSCCLALQACCCFYCCCKCCCRKKKKKNLTKK